MNEQICIQPFTALEIDSFGDVYTCCPSYINYNKIGNILSDNISSLADIWYSDKACELRRRILAGDYSLCNLQLCRQRHFSGNKSDYEIKPKLPWYITLAYDKECNLQCITCRDKKIKNDKETTELFNNKIDTLLLPLLTEAKIVALSGSGEAFFSSHSRLLIKKLTAQNKNLIFNINTNGLLFNQNNCSALGLTNRINEVFVSLPALDKKLYNKIMIGSDLQTVLKNIQWMAHAQKEKQINKITINTVISDINYKEIPKLVKFAKKLNIYITISQYYHWGTKFGENYSDLTVWEANHKHHKDFVKILKKDILNYEKVILSPAFKELRENNIKKTGIFNF